MGYAVCLKSVHMIGFNTFSDYCHLQSQSTEWHPFSPIKTLCQCFKMTCRKLKFSLLEFSYRVVRSAKLVCQLFFLHILYQ